ncbi:MAG: Mor transcription activator family protein [Pseudomonadales bacterium]|nr:Mor transcription activator family protein [Pseudomonadales bacterium]
MTPAQTRALSAAYAADSQGGLIRSGALWLAGDQSHAHNIVRELADNSYLFVYAKGERASITARGKEALAQQPETDQLDTQDMPAVVREIADVIGISHALRIVQAYAGTRVYIPDQVGTDHHLAELLPRDALDKLSAHYARESVVIPVCAKAVRSARDKEISRQQAAGMSVAALARRYALTERQIYSILARQQATSTNPAPQLQLFGA